MPLPVSELEAEQLEKKVTESSVRVRKEVLIAIPQSIIFLRDAVLELWCLGWVEENTPELVGDATARRELRARRTETEREVSEQLTTLFGGSLASLKQKLVLRLTVRAAPGVAYGIIVENRHQLSQEEHSTNTFRQSVTLFIPKRQSFVMNSSIDDKSPRKQRLQDENLLQQCLSPKDRKNWALTAIHPK